MTLAQAAVPLLAAAATAAFIGAFRTGRTRIVATIASVVLALTAGTAVGLSRWKSNHQPLTAARQSISLTGASHTTVWFGRLDAVVAQLEGRVAFKVAPAAVTEDGDRCVLTVVAEGISTGQDVTLAAGGLGANWAGFEDQPDKRPDLTGGVIHEQLIAPSTAIAVGTTFTARTFLQVDGTSGAPGSFTLALHGRDGDGTSRWRLNDGRDVECRSASS